MKKPTPAKLSLSPLTPEEALRAALNSPPLKSRKKPQPSKKTAKKAKNQSPEK